MFFLDSTTKCTVVGVCRIVEGDDGTSTSRGIAGGVARLDRKSYVLPKLQNNGLSDFHACDGVVSLLLIET